MIQHSMISKDVGTKTQWKRLCGLLYYVLKLFVEHYNSNQNILGFSSHLDFRMSDVLVL